MTKEIERHLGNYIQNIPDYLSDQRRAHSEFEEGYDPFFDSDELIFEHEKVEVSMSVVPDPIPDRKIQKRLSQYDSDDIELINSGELHPEDVFCNSAEFSREYARTIGEL